MAHRHLRKLEALWNETEHIHECDFCVWVVRVSPDRHLDEVQMEFDAHKCEDFRSATKAKC
jgi:hypothetical protein